MASTYSTNLALELPGTGDQSGTWGTTANRDMGTLLEQAISGYVEQQFNTDADITLSLLSGADGGGNVTPGIIYGTSTPGTAASPVSARNMYIRCTGTLSAARILTVPANRKLYYIYNNTTGGFAITVKTAAGSGISVPNGSKMLLVCDGANIVESINYFSSLTFSSLTVTGAVTLSGGTANGVAYLNGGKVLTTGTGLTYDGSLLNASNNLKIGGGAASNTSKLMVNTVSGVSAGIQLIQDSNESWIIQNPASTTALTFSNSGSERMRLDASGNVGIGTASPLSKLDVTSGYITAGTAVATSSSKVLASNYNAGALTTLGSEFANGGPVLGYGVWPSTVSADAFVSSTSIASPRGAYVIAGGDHKWFSGGSQTVAIDSSVTLTEKMRLDASGNLGIGTSPSSGYRLWVNTSGAQSGAIFRSDSGYTQITATDGNVQTFVSFTSGSGVSAISYHGTSSNHPLGLITNNIERMRIDTSGNLGLGATPSSWLSSSKALQIKSYSSLFESSVGITSLSFNAYEYALGAYKYIQSEYASVYQQVSGNHVWQSATSGVAGGVVTFIERMRIDTSGNLLTGNTYAIFNAVNRTTIEVNGASQALLGMGVGGTSAGYLLHDGTNMDVWQFRNGYMRFGTNNSERMRLNNAGQLVVGGTAPAAYEVICATVPDNPTAPLASWNKDTTGNNYFVAFWTEATATIRGSIVYNRAAGQISYNITSDYRAKDIFGPVTDSGSVIDSLKVYNGKMKDATIVRPMAVAHEVQDVVPYAVIGEKDAVDKDGKPIYQQIDYSALVPLLIAEVQSLRARVAHLEGK